MLLTLDLLKEVELTAISNYDRSLICNRLTRGQQLFIEEDGMIKDPQGFKIAKIKGWNKIEELIL